MSYLGVYYIHKIKQRNTKNTKGLKIMIDSVQSSRFITKKKSESLIKKLKSLASKPQAREFSGQIYIYDRIKSMNESIFYNVDTLHNAIASTRKITFRYYDDRLSSQVQHNQRKNF